MLLSRLFIAPAKNMEQATEHLVETGMDATKAKLKGTEQYAIEAAMIKVHASETLDYVNRRRCADLWRYGLQCRGPNGQSLS